jgi:hypothetical protein
VEKSNLTRFSRFAGASLAAVLVLAALLLIMAERGAADDDAARVVKNYLAATYARDFARAYGLISERDKKIVSQADFVRSRGAYSGFALRLAEDLASGMEFKVIEDARAGDRAHVKAAVKLPAPEDLSALVENWNIERLNALPPTRQRYTLDRIAALRREQKLTLVQSQESFDLIKEGKNWRLFFDWASGVRVRFDFRAPPGSGIEMDFAEKEIIVRPQEPFLVHFKIKNRGRREVTATVAHRIEPTAARENLEMIQCGLLSPIDLAPGSEREMAGVYLLDGLPDIKHLSIAYEFQVAPAAKSRSPRKGN